MPDHDCHVDDDRCSRTVNVMMLMVKHGILLMVMMFLIVIVMAVLVNT